MLSCLWAKWLDAFTKQVKSYSNFVVEFVHTNDFHSRQLFLLTHIFTPALSPILSLPFSPTLFHTRARTPSSSSSQPFLRRDTAERYLKEIEELRARLAQLPASAASPANSEEMSRRAQEHRLRVADTILTLHCPK